jgi:hypothetical protein
MAHPTGYSTNMVPWSPSLPIVPVTALQQEMKSFLDTSSIITKEQCAGKDVIQLKSDFEIYKQKFDTLFQDSKKILDSQQFSFCIREAEQMIESLENINAVCFNKVTENQINDFRIMEKELLTKKQELSTMHANLPLGPSILLKQDMENLRTLGTVSSNSMYSSELGSFHEPRITRLQLAGWAEKFNENKIYTGVSVTWKTDKIYTYRFPVMVTFVALEKNDSLQTQEEAYYQNPSSTHLNNPIATYSQISESTSMKPKAFFQKLQMMQLRPQQEHRSFIDFKSNQLLALSAMSKDAENKLAEWNFERVETLSYKELREKYQLSSDDAKRCDFVLFFHKVWLG